MAQAFDLVWPWDGMEQVPVDAAVIVYGRTWDRPLGEWELEIVSESGATVPCTVSVGGMTDDYFLIVAVPDEELAEDTPYNGIFRPVDGEAEPMEFVFRTGPKDAPPASAAVPAVDYHGVGVPLKDEDDGFCISSLLEEAGGLAVTITGDGLVDRPILIEARDSQEEKVFDMLLSGSKDIDGQQVVGSDLCRAHFPVDPCEQYCMRAAALDHRGQPGPWSEWSCSGEIGYWECGDLDEDVLFGADVPEGVKPSAEAALQACLGEGYLAPQSGGAETGGEELADPDGASAEEDATAGCSMAAHHSEPFGLLLAFSLLAALLLAVLRRRGRVRVLGIVFLAALLGVLVGCDEPSSSRADVATADLQVDGGEEERSDLAADAQPRGDAGCQNVRRFSDWKNPYDTCWDPPLHYCSDGENAAETTGCSAQGTVCCVLAEGGRAA